VDKFTKWAEAKPAASITAVKAVEFIKEMMYRFGIPNKLSLLCGSSRTFMQTRALQSTMP
jgi:hypothetical protein